MILCTIDISLMCCLRNHCHWHEIRFKLNRSWALCTMFQRMGAGISGTLRNYYTEESNTHHQKSTSINSSRWYINKNGVGRISYILHSTPVSLDLESLAIAWKNILYVLISNMAPRPCILRSTDHKTKTQAVAARHKALPCLSPSLTI